MSVYELIKALIDESDTLYQALSMFRDSWPSEGHLANCDAAKTALDTLVVYSEAHDSLDCKSNLASNDKGAGVIP